MLLTAAVLQTAYDVGEPIYELAREKMVGAVSVMAVCASVPGQRSPSAARATAKTRLAAVLGLREGARRRRSPGTARAPTTKLAPRPNAFGDLTQGGAPRGGPSRAGRIWLGSAQKPV